MTGYLDIFISLLGHFRTDLFLLLSRLTTLNSNPYLPLTKLPFNLYWYSPILDPEHIFTFSLTLLISFGGAPEPTNAGPKPWRFWVT